MLSRNINECTFKEQRSKLSKEISQITPVLDSKLEGKGLTAKQIKYFLQSEPKIEFVDLARKPDSYKVEYKYKTITTWRQIEELMSSKAELEFLTSILIGFNNQHLTKERFKDLVTKMKTFNPLELTKKYKNVNFTSLMKHLHVNLQDEINGNTPLFLATTLDQSETIKKLLAAGADINLVGGKIKIV